MDQMFQRRFSNNHQFPLLFGIIGLYSYRIEFVLSVEVVPYV